MYERSCRFFNGNATGELDVSELLREKTQLKREQMVMIIAADLELKFYAATREKLAAERETLAAQKENMDFKIHVLRRAELLKEGIPQDPE